MEDDKKNEFLRAYDEYGEAIYRHCFFRVYSKSRAEELVQETFLRAWQYIKQEKIHTMRPFLYQIANNLIIDNARKKKEESLESLLTKSAALEPSYSGQKDIERNLELKEVLGAMRHVSEEDRQLLTMRYVDDLDPKEIAKILGITANNVSVRLNRGVKNLKSKFSTT